MLRTPEHRRQARLAAPHLSPLQRTDYRTGVRSPWKERVGFCEETEPALMNVRE